MNRPMIGCAFLAMALFFWFPGGEGVSRADAPNKPRPVKAVSDGPAETRPLPVESAHGPWFSWEAKGKVDLGGPEALPVSRHGRLQAKDLEGARRAARAEFDKMIALQFAGQAKLLEPSVELKVSPLEMPRGKNTVAGLHQVRIEVVLTCFTSWEFESRLFLVGGTKRVSDFLVKAAVEAEGKTDAMEGSIATFTRGGKNAFRRFLLWQGPVYLDERGTEVTVKLDQFRNRVDIGPEGWAEETTPIGKFRIRVINQGGRLVASVQPLEHVRIEPPGQGLTTRTTMNGGESFYRGTIVVSSPEETALARAEAKKKQAERNEVFRPRPGEAVEVFNGSVTQDINDPLNKRRSKVGLKRVIVIAARPEIGAAYVDRVYPKRKDFVKVVHDRKEAEDYLLREWRALVQAPPYKQYEFIPDTLRVSLTPKKGETILDRLSKFPKRKRP